MGGARCAYYSVREEVKTQIKTRHSLIYCDLGKSANVCHLVTKIYIYLKFEANTDPSKSADLRHLITKQYTFCEA